MSKACKITGPLHADVRRVPTTKSGAKTELIDVYPDKDLTIAYEVNVGTPKKPKMKPLETNVRRLIRRWVLADRALKQTKALAEELAEGLKRYVVNFRRYRFTDTGKYEGSYRLNGEVSRAGEQYAVSMAAQDRFSLPKTDTEIDAIKEILGKETFDNYFERDFTVSIRKEVIESRDLRKEFLQKVTDALGGEKELAKWFEKSEVWAVKEGLAEELVKLDEDTVGKLDEVCPQYADQIKNVSYDPKG